MAVPLAAVAMSVLALLPAPAHAEDFLPPATAIVAPATLRYPVPGEFRRASANVAAPVVDIRFSKPFEIMRFQVAAKDHARCVAAGACRTPDRAGASTNGANHPVTGTSFEDALEYALWLSSVTGDTWRLPTDAEWALAAASRFAPDPGLAASAEADPSKAWLQNYRRMVLSSAAIDRTVHAQGYFGANEHGVYDMAGNIWEWTQGCYVRAVLDDAGKVLRSIENCGVRVVEGRHRTYVTSFIRDAAGGGCSVGTPPEHLGFRLVREGRTAVLRRLSAWIAGLR